MLGFGALYLVARRFVRREKGPPNVGIAGTSAAFFSRHGAVFLLMLAVSMLGWIHQASIFGGEATLQAMLGGPSLSEVYACRNQRPPEGQPHLCYWGGDISRTEDGRLQCSKHGLLEEAADAE